MHGECFAPGKVVATLAYNCHARPCVSTCSCTCVVRRRCAGQVTFFLSFSFLFFPSFFSPMFSHVLSFFHRFCTFFPHFFTFFPPFFFSSFFMFFHFFTFFPCFFSMLPFFNAFFIFSQLFPFFVLLIFSAFFPIFPMFFLVFHFFFFFFTFHFFYFFHFFHFSPFFHFFPFFSPFFPMIFVNFGPTPTFPAVRSTFLAEEEAQNVEILPHPKFWSLLGPLPGHLTFQNVSNLFTPEALNT